MTGNWEDGGVVERRARAVAEGISHVSNDLAIGRTALQAAQDRMARHNARHHVLGALDRLGNFVSLAHEMHREVQSPNIKKILDESLKILGKQLTGLTGAIVLDRVRTLQREAENTLERHEVPIGKAGLLRQRFIHVVGMIRTLNISLIPEDEEELRIARVTINSLIERERLIRPFGLYEDAREVNIIRDEDMVFDTAA